jgi:PilZ domain
MPDKIITNFPIEESDAFDLSQDIADILASFSSQESTGAPSQTKQAHESNKNNHINSHKKMHASIGVDSDHRKHHRHLVRWRVAIVNTASEKNDIYHGRTHNLSLSGASILLEHNISFSSEVVILLAIPPMHLGQKETIIEIQSKITYTLLDSVHSQFRLAMNFIYFKGDGKRILSDVLSKRHIPNIRNYNQ